MPHRRMAHGHVEGARRKAAAEAAQQPKGAPGALFGWLTKGKVAPADTVEPAAEQGDADGGMRPDLDARELEKLEELLAAQV